MRALTVRQPWAWAIVHGGKDVENRTRNIAGAYRGPVAIHAGLTDAALDWTPARVFNDWRTWWQENEQPPAQRGHIIGVVDLVDVHRQDFLPSPDGDPAKYAQCSPWAQYDLVPRAMQVPHQSMWHLVLANARPLAEPIPYRGRLGLWTLPDGVAAQVTSRTAHPPEAPCPEGCRNPEHTRSQP